MVVNEGVLTVAHSIFKRWRPLFRSDALFTEIKYVLENFSQPFLNLLQRVDLLIKENSNNKNELIKLFQVMLLLIKIYYDLNCQDIPEFFEDNLEIGMSIIHTIFNYQNPLLNTDDDDEAGILEKIKSAICELIQLYTVQYEDVFQSKIPIFIETCWSLLVSIGPESKYDILVSKALGFLTAVAKMPRHSDVFKTEQAIKEITEKIILPNIQLRDSDEELFEDDPIEYTRRDLEGSDTDTRRRAATDFLRELKDGEQSSATQIIMEYVSRYLQEWQQDNSKWRAKDTAVYLFTSIAVKGTISTSGVSSSNLLLDVVGFFSTNIAPDLLNKNGNPILIVDAIKYIYTFRNQLTKQQLLEAFPLLSLHFLSNEYVVYTYTAITFEKILSIRNDNGSFIFDKDDISPFSQELLNNLFGLILRGSTPEKLAENEFLMKCIMRVLITTSTNVKLYGDAVLGKLIEIILEISKNPSNPRFSHYSFEAISILIKSIILNNGSKHIQELIFPSFLSLLSQDVQEFVPYILQIFSFILELTPNSEGVSDNFKQLIGPLLSPAVWEFRGNIPAIVRLLKAIISKNPELFNNNDSLTPLLGVFQKLISSKANDNYGFELIENIFIYIPFNTLNNFTKTIATLLLTRLQNSKTDKFIKLFTRLICFLSAIETNQLGPTYSIEFIDQVQNGLFGNIFSTFILPTALNITNNLDKKIIIVGLTKILTENQKFISGDYSDKWIPALDEVIQLAVSNSVISTSASAQAQTGVSLEALDEIAFEQVGFGSHFSKLVMTTVKPLDPLPAISLYHNTSDTNINIKVYVRQKLNLLDKEIGGGLGRIVEQLSEKGKEGFKQLAF